VNFPSWLKSPFLLALGERAVKTFAQTLLASLTLSAAPVDLLHANWAADLSLAAGAALLSVLTSLTSLTPLSPEKGDHAA